MHQRVDIIIPTYKPDEKLMRLIEKLENQTYAINKIIVMNTEEKYWDKLFFGTDFLRQYGNIEVHHISKKEFDHGETRNAGVDKSTAEIFVCMTQDAVPNDNMLIEALVNGLLAEQDIAAAYARQLPNENCREIEKCIRAFNYPYKSRMKGKEDINKLGIKTFFCSNVCAAYNREIFEKMGGFPENMIFNEDMVYAGHAVNEGYKIAYVAEAKVIHSHNYSHMQQFHRNFDLGVSQAMHPEVFKIVSSESEGVSLVKEVTKHLLQLGKINLILYFYINCGFKYIGYKLGLQHEKLNYGIIIKCTDNKQYWERQE